MKRLLLAILVLPLFIFGTAYASGMKFATSKLSNSHPCQYSWETYSAKIISGNKAVVGANVKISVRYKTTTHNYNASKANKKGSTSKRFYISGATSGRKVSVVVTATKSGNTIRSTVYFTPKKCP